MANFYIYWQFFAPFWQLFVFSLASLTTLSNFWKVLVTIMLPCHHVIKSSQITLSSWHIFILLSCHIFIMSSYHLVILSFCQFICLWACNLVSFSACASWSCKLVSLLLVLNRIFIGPRKTWGLIFGSGCPSVSKTPLWNLTDVTLANGYTNSIPTDNANKV